MNLIKLLQDSGLDIDNAGIVYMNELPVISLAKPLLALKEKLETSKAVGFLKINPNYEYSIGVIDTPSLDAYLKLVTDLGVGEYDLYPLPRVGEQVGRISHTPDGKPYANWLLGKVLHDGDPLYVRSTSKEVAWLVENGKQGNELRYRTMKNGHIEWTADVNEALRFSRRIDAENFCQEDEDAWRVAEHMWG